MKKLKTNPIFFNPDNLRRWAIVNFPKFLIFYEGHGFLLDGNTLFKNSLNYFDYDGQLNKSKDDFYYNYYQHIHPYRINSRFFKLDVFLNNNNIFNIFITLMNYFINVFNLIWDLNIPDKNKEKYWKYYMHNWENLEKLRKFMIFLSKENDDKYKKYSQKHDFNLHFEENMWTHHYLKNKEKIIIEWLKENYGK